ncbi:MAG: DinB family protein [Phycisphaerales bacterium]
MKQQEMLAEMVLSGRDLFVRYLAGFDDSTHTRIAPGCPNHVAWCLGHCALVMYRFAEKLDGMPLPASDFVVADLGDPQRFGTESVAFGSAPKLDASAFPTFARCQQIFSDATVRLARWVAGATTEQLERNTVFFPRFEAPAWRVVPRVVFHSGHHCGQVADLRRALGMKSIFA